MYYNCNKAGYIYTKYPYPRHNTNLNKIMEQKDSNNNVKEIQQIKNYNLLGNRNI
jgi:hypothetical protein